MLSEQEKRNCSELLELLPEDDIFSLMHTSTNRTVSTRSRKEAITAILQFTQSIDEFFKRRKISKDLLLKYIYQQSWSVPRDGDLHVIKDYIIQKWERSRMTASGASNVKTESAVARSFSSQNQQSIQEAHSPRPVPDRIAFTQISNYNNNKYVVNNIVNNTTLNVQLPVPTSSFVTTDTKIQEYQSAVSFVGWFYSLLNACSPDMGSQVGDFGPQHFWKDAQMRLEMTTKGRHVSETLDGAEAVAGKLLSFPVSDRLLFCPTVSEDGLKIRSQTFERKVILVCGQLRKGGIRVGSFYQSFGLIPDPAMNSSYKVRITLLKMVEYEGHLMPSLTHDNDAALMEGLTLSAIEGPQ